MEAAPIHEESPLLQKLPRELRDEIYREALTSPQDIVVFSTDKIKNTTKTENELKNVVNAKDKQNALGTASDKCRCALPALLNVCKQVRHEATPVFYASNTFRAIILDGVGLVSPVRWLHNISPGNLRGFQGLIMEIRFTTVQYQKLSNRAGLKFIRSRSVGAIAEQAIKDGELANVIAQQDNRELEVALQSLSPSALIKLKFSASADAAFGPLWMGSCWVLELNESLIRTLRARSRTEWWRDGHVR